MQTKKGKGAELARGVNVTNRNHNHREERRNENVSTLVSRDSSFSKFMHRSISIVMIFTKRPNQNEVQTLVNFKDTRF